MTELMDKIKKSRTFAIISHPDAGKQPLPKSCCFTAELFTWQAP